MKLPGIIGGTGPESTVDYYQRLIAAYQKRVGTDHVPPMVINSVNYKKLVAWFEAGDLQAVTDFLADEIERLARAGAEFGLIAANTPHLVFDQLQKRVQLPLLSIIEATANAAEAIGGKRFALFGTRFTMESAMFPDVFAKRGLSVIAPNEEERTFIHDIYMGELVAGKIRDETRDHLVQIVKRMKERDNIDALILGGTELSLILREPTAGGLPVLDTTQIHVDAAIDRMLQD